MVNADAIQNCIENLNYIYGESEAKILYRVAQENFTRGLI